MAEMPLLRTESARYQAEERSSLELHSVHDAWLRCEKHSRLKDAQCIRVQDLNRIRQMLYGQFETRGLRRVMANIRQAMAGHYFLLLKLIQVPDNIFHVSVVYNLERCPHQGYGD